jgi:hypothetical protein
VPYNTYELNSLNEGDETEEDDYCTQNSRKKTFANPECEIKKQYLGSRYCNAWRSLSQGVRWR